MNIKHICFTAFSTEERKELSEKAINLGLIVDTNFEIYTEVLIAHRIGTDKYRLAAEKKIPILKKEWLLACETEGELVSIEKYKLPCLYNCTISVTGFKEKERSQIKNLCEQNGASYSSSLTTGYTHLICLKGGSEKFHFALSNNITVVGIDWIKKSVKAGYALDEADFILSTISEEEKQQCLEIANKFKQQIGLEMEEVVKPSVKHSILQTQGMKLDTSSTESFSLSSQFSSEDVQLSLFNGLVFYLVGFPTDLVTSVRKLIRKYGGNATFTTNSLNYIIANDNTPPETIKNLKEKLNYDPPVVSYKWFLNCIESMQVLPIEEKNEQNEKISSSTFDDNNIDIDISEEDLADAIQSQTCITNEMTHEKNEKLLFSSLLFKLADNLLSQKQIAKSIIERNGGKFVNLGLDYDFIIYPESCKTPRETNPKIRTLKWLKDSDAEKTVKTAEECLLYVPTFRLALDKIKTENERLLIVISGYPDQKQILQSIIEALGGSTSKTMRKTADILVCEKKSDKSDFAIKHQIPVVNEKWLFDSYKAGYFLSPTDFIFNPNSTNSNITPNISVKTSITTTNTTDKNINKDTSTSTTPTEKKSTNLPVFEKTEKADKEDQITPTKTIILDENARDSNSPHSTTNIQPPTMPAPPTPTTVIPVDTAALTNFKSKLLDKLPKRKDTTTKAIEFSEQSNVHFIPKKNLENLTFFNSQNTSESNSLSHYGGTSEAENEYNEKVKNDRNRTIPDFAMSLGTFAETQVIDHDNEVQKIKWKQSNAEKRHFLLSSLAEKQKKEVTKYIQALDGVIDELYIPNVTTHFIAGSAVQTEKFLCSVAAGIWILCPKYVEDSYQQQYWIQEDDYQWIHKQADIKSDQQDAIRYLITAQKIRDNKTKPFSGMSVFFVQNTNPSFVRIITAGGGVILPSITDPRLTHIFVKEASDTEDMKKAYPNTFVTYEEQISGFLMTDEKKTSRETSSEESEKKKRKVIKKSK
ncbi:hypothetical protein NAEGRDRAFT_61854 [Naegleria gruberi]|uniref:Uncharacterized protein AM39 n=1 Tax=Naegleria gruberi TaxID=5762 RepID=D2UZ93_NAEGR|nr:uncharacterized protein NAEGRDRAFT_61854 [Naegleria gruberi]EFC49904.1 hypothetical protein NAEGRDRAFT_61854 [Naegleria gruberi]|eukprot:XP_002682648.1 hypothetical protein NAEGRDRAFT_61854 [Naegleria gruberi strain NEG-M]